MLNVVLLELFSKYLEPLGNDCNFGTQENRMSLLYHIVKQTGT